MATNTTNLSLIKPAGTDKVRIAQINQNMDILDEKIGPVGNTSIQNQIIANNSGMAIVSTGNTHSAIASGQYVYIRSHSNLAEGLYKANSAISANATLSTSNVTRVSSGGMNDLKGQIDSLNSQKVAYALGNDTIANIQSAIVTLAGTMTDGEVKNVRCNISAASGVFKITAYIGKLMRISSSRLCVDFRESMDANDSIIGNYKDGTWYWSQLQTKIYVLDFYNTATGAYQTDISAGNVIGCHVMNWGSDIVAAIHVGTNDKALIHVYSASTGAVVTNTSVRLRLYYV